MDKRVILFLKGMSDSNPDAPMEFITEGRYTRDGDTYLVTYEESAMTGMEGTTTTMKVSADTVTMIRAGTVNTHFVFRQGEKNVSRYTTEFGVFTLSILARELTVKLDDNGGELDIRYDLESFQKEASKNHFYLKIREISSG